MRRPPMLLALAVSLLALVPFQAVLRAAITVAVAVNDHSTANVAAYTSTHWPDTFSLASGEAAICWVANTDADAAETPVSLTWETGGEAFTPIRSGAGASTFSLVTSYYYATAHASSALTAVIHASDAQTGAALHCLKLTGANVAALVIQGDVDDQVNTLTPTGSVAARTANSALLSMIFVYSANVGCTSTPEYATFDTLQTIAAPDSNSQTQWDIGGSDTSPLTTLATCNASTDTLVASEEIAIGAGGGTVNKLLMLGVGEVQ